MVEKEIKGSGGKKGFSPGMGTAINAFFGATDYLSAREQGDGVFSSLGQAALGFALPEMMGTKLYMGTMMMSSLGGLAMDMYESANQYMRAKEKSARDATPFKTNTFVDNQQIYTMRQAGMALARQSKYNLQQTTIGNEARFLHR
jgi:hypothetical protein